MNRSIIPLAAAGALLIAGTSAVAVAQTAAPEDGPGARAEATRAQFRGGRGGHGGLGLGGRGMGPELFEEVDGDGDGSVTQEEVDAYLEAELAAADADGDGAVGLEEFAPVFAERMRPRMVDAFQALDEDGSGAVSAAELDDRFGAVVARLDRDGDDALTLQDGRRGRDRD